MQGRQGRIAGRSWPIHGFSPVMIGRPLKSVPYMTSVGHLDYFRQNMPHRRLPMFGQRIVIEFLSSGTPMGSVLGKKIMNNTKMKNLLRHSVNLSSSTTSACSHQICNLLCSDRNAFSFNSTCLYGYPQRSIYANTSRNLALH